MKNLKRVLSLMMAVLLCFGLFPGSALAAENDYDGYLAMIEYKDRRYSLSENLPAPFGGRTTEEFFELRINDLRTYRTAYCIQMGVRANSGIGYEASDDYASFTEEQKALINTSTGAAPSMSTSPLKSSSGSLPTTSLAQGMRARSWTRSPPTAPQRSPSSIPCGKT